MVLLTCTSGFFAAVVEAEVQRAGEDQDHRQHLHGRGRTPARKRGRQSCKCRPGTRPVIDFLGSYSTTVSEELLLLVL